MMRKKVCLLLIVAVLLIATLGVLYACGEDYDVDPIKPSGDKNAPVESNGGLVVKQGGYLYFVNGYTGYLTSKGDDNAFGKVRKGAIVRVTYNEDGTLGTDYKVIVPKSVMASSANLGFSIYGNYIYYVSPCKDEDRSGKVQTNILEFFRTKLDGTGTQKILSWNSNSVSYKYTPEALVYYDSANGKIYSKTFKNKKDGFDPESKGNCIASGVQSVHFIKNESYDPAVGVTVADYIIYTKGSDSTGENTLCITDPHGSVTKTPIVPGTFQSEDYRYSVSVVASAVENGKLAIYYTKTEYVGTATSGSAIGTYAYQFEDTEFTFNVNKEKMITANALSSVYPLGYTEGVVATTSNAVLYYMNGAAPVLYNSLDLSNLITIQASETLGKTAFYYLSSNKLLYYAVDDTENAHYAYTTDETFMSGFIDAEYFDGYFYFILDDDYDYMARIKLEDINIRVNDSVEIERVALFTSADQKAFDEAKAEAEEEAND